MRRLLRAAIVAAIVLGGGSAHAYPLYSLGTQLRGHAWSWSYSGRDSDGQPYQNAHASQESIRAAITESFRAFDEGAVKDAAGNACSSMRFTEVTGDGGFSTSRMANGDGENTEGVFVTKREDPIYNYMRGGVVAFAVPLADTEGYVADCDTVFNAVSNGFGTDGAGGVGLQDVAMQETAHCFGLHHVCQQSPGDGQPPCDGPDVDLHSVMFPFAMHGFGASEPDARDQDNMCQVYPANGIGRPCDARDPSANTGFLVPDCDDGTSCLCTDVGKICSKTCASNAECPAGSRCETGACVPDFYPGTQLVGVATRTGVGCDTRGLDHKPIGSTCEADADCGGGMHCATSVPGGYCTIDCLHSRCPAGSECVGGLESVTDALCVKPCKADENTCATSDCASGQHCQPFAPRNAGVCWASCRTDLDCDPSGKADMLCDTATGTCFARGEPKLCDPYARHGLADPGSGACVPSCDGKACGEGDGCGGECTSELCPHPGGGGNTGGARSGCGVSDVGGLAFAASALLLARRRRIGG